MSMAVADKRRTVKLLVAGLLLAVSLCLRSEAQTSTQHEEPSAKDASPAFLVATIKPSAPDETHDGFPGDGRHLGCINQTVASILSVAYGIHIKQIVGGPEWASRNRFDINGVADVPGPLDLPQQQEMWRKLLAERFHLVFHKEVRPLPIYAITVAKGGPMLKVADPTERVNTGNSGSGGQRVLKFRNMSMAGFALNMNFYEDRPVIDQTSLTGRYDFTLKWTYDISAPSDPDAAPSLVTAIKEQIGLEMKAVKGPAEVIVIDHVELPTEN